MSFGESWTKLSKDNILNKRTRSKSNIEEKEEELKSDQYKSNELEKDAEVIQKILEETEGTNELEHLLKPFLTEDEDSSELDLLNQQIKNSSNNNTLENSQLEDSKLEKSKSQLEKSELEPDNKENSETLIINVENPNPKELNRSIKKEPNMSEVNLKAEAQNYATALTNEQRTQISNKIPKEKMIEFLEYVAKCDETRLDIS